MRTGQQGFIVIGAALAVWWAGTAGAQGGAPPQRCKAGQAHDLLALGRRRGQSGGRHTELHGQRRQDDHRQQHQPHVATLNTTTFAGYNDSRVPNLKELQSILNYAIPTPDPTVSPALNSAACDRVGPNLAVPEPFLPSAEASALRVRSINEATSANALYTPFN